MHHDIHEYIYMDTDGIDSIAAQISENKIEEINVRTITGKKNKTNGIFGFPGLLSKFLKAEVGASGVTESTKIIDEKATIPYERKIQLIIEYIANNGPLISNFYDILEIYDSDRTNFINAALNFDTKYKNWSEALNQAEKYGCITFTIGGNDDTYDENENYYKNVITYGKKIVMNMGINN